MNATNINFTDRATYKAWMANWKAGHAQLLADIRTAKNEIKNANRDINSGRNVGRIWAAYSNLHKLHNDLSQSLLQRADAKIEAQRQYMAEKAVVA